MPLWRDHGSSLRVKAVCYKTHLLRSGTLYDLWHQFENLGTTCKMDPKLHKATVYGSECVLPISSQPLELVLSKKHIVLGSE